MVNTRVRIRFRKDGDLRFLGHRDLSRAFERTLRRAGIPIALSQGMRPKPRIMFPSALAVGIAGTDEVVETDLTEAWSEDEVRAALTDAAAPGWRFDRITIVPADRKAAVAVRTEYAFPLPEHRRASAGEAVADRLAEGKIRYRREEIGREFDLEDHVPSLRLEDGVLRFVLLLSSEGQVRPREILQALGVADLEAEGVVLTRTMVELAD